MSCRWRGETIWQERNTKLKVLHIHPSNPSSIQDDRDQDNRKSRRLWSDRITASTLASNASSVRVSLTTSPFSSSHPLPILSISEHLTRVSLQARSTDVQSELIRSQSSESNLNLRDRSYWRATGNTTGAGYRDYEQFRDCGRSG